MQIFNIDVEPIQTAYALDNKRFHRQLSEAKLIYNGILGLNGWNNSIVAKMYQNHLKWLECYINVFENIKVKNTYKANYWNDLSKQYTPEFLSEEYILNMKRRLYTKDPIFYKDWEIYGKSNINMYYINHQWKYYQQS